MVIIFSAGENNVTEYTALALILTNKKKSANSGGRTVFILI